MAAELRALGASLSAHQRRAVLCSAPQREGGCGHERGGLGTSGANYFETCSCDYLCPCIFTNMTAMPTDRRLQGRDRAGHRGGALRRRAARRRELRHQRGDGGRPHGRRQLDRRPHHRRGARATRRSTPSGASAPGEEGGPDGADGAAHRHLRRRVERAPIRIERRRDGLLDHRRRPAAPRGGRRAQPARPVRDHHDRQQPGIPPTSACTSPSGATATSTPSASTGTTRPAATTATTRPFDWRPN